MTDKMDIPNPDPGYDYRYVQKSLLASALAKGFSRDPSGKEAGDMILMRRSKPSLPSTPPTTATQTSTMRTVPKSREGASNA